MALTDVELRRAHQQGAVDHRCVEVAFGAKAMLVVQQRHLGAAAIGRVQVGGDVAFDNADCELVGVLVERGAQHGRLPRPR